MRLKNEYPIRSLNFLYIIFLKVLLNLSTTADFISELLVEYSLILFSVNKSCTCLL